MVGRFVGKVRWCLRYEYISSSTVRFKRIVMRGLLLVFKYEEGPAHYNLIDPWVHSSGKINVRRTAFKEPTIKGMHQRFASMFCFFSYETLFTEQLIVLASERLFRAPFITSAWDMIVISVYTRIERLGLTLHCEV